MASSYLFYKVALVVLAASLLVVLPVEATYRKPPFNGSIFGKRNGVVNGDYESASKALSAMCEIASEACQSWFPSQDN